MPTHAQKQRLPYSQARLFDLVANIERYPEFLPWCVACRVTRRDGDVISGDLAVGFRMFRETFASRVTLTRPDRIDVEYVDGPFRFLKNHWRFIAEGPSSTTIDFFIDFEFRSKLLAVAIGPLFDEAVRRMVGAFEKRADALYGSEQRG